MISDAWAVQIRTEISLIGMCHGTIDDGASVKTWVLPSRNCVYAIYRTALGQQRRMVIPKEKIAEREDLYRQHFPARWQDPIA